jgi:HTH-type transcriptional regulator/antitoxin HigA
MKTTLIVIQNEADHADAKELIEKLMGSSDPQDRARMVAQARLVEAYERTQWPRTAPTLPALLAYLMDQHSLSRADLVPLLGSQPCERGPDRQTGLEHDNGAQTP